MSSVESDLSIFDEVAPNSAPKPPTDIKGKFKALISGDPPAPKASNPTGETPPRGRGRPKGSGVKADKRSDGSDIWGTVWAVVGKYGVARQAPFAGAAMSMQAPVVGPILDEKMGGTLVDRRVIQPLARNRGSWEALVACMQLPILCEAYGRAYTSGRVEAMDAIRPELIKAAKKWFTVMAPVMKKQAEEEAKTMALLKDIYPDSDDKTLDDWCEGYLDKIFSSVFPTPPNG